MLLLNSKPIIIVYEGNTGKYLKMPACEGNIEISQIFGGISRNKYIFAGVYFA